MRFLIMRFSSQTRFNKELYEISAVLNYAIVQQLAFFAFVCITQLFLALRYIYIFVSMGSPFGPAWAPVDAQRANVRPAE